jgi:hypothetical protein
LRLKEGQGRTFKEGRKEGQGRKVKDGRSRTEGGREGERERWFQVKLKKTSIRPEGANEGKKGREGGRGGGSVEGTLGKEWGICMDRRPGGRSKGKEEGETALCFLFLSVISFNHSFFDQ